MKKAQAATQAENPVKRIGWLPFPRRTSAPAAAFDSLAVELANRLSEAADY
jgi:hypothetical protein